MATTLSCCARSGTPSVSRWWRAAVPATLEHFARGVIEGGADAVLAASRLHFGQLTIGQIKEHLRERGVEVRL